jgi:hypothetical protein
MKRIPVPSAAFLLAVVSLSGATAATLAQDAPSQDASAAACPTSSELCATSGIGRLSMARASGGIALNWNAWLALTVWTPANVGGLRESVAADC